MSGLELQTFNWKPSCRSHYLVVTCTSTISNQDLGLPSALLSGALNKSLPNATLAACVHIPWVPFSSPIATTCSQPMIVCSRSRGLRWHCKGCSFSLLAQRLWYAAEPLLDIMEVRDKKLLEQASDVSMDVSCSPSYLQRNLRKSCEAWSLRVSVPGQDWDLGVFSSRSSYVDRLEKAQKGYLYAFVVKSPILFY